MKQPAHFVSKQTLQEHFSVLNGIAINEVVGGRVFIHLVVMVTFLLCHVAYAVLSFFVVLQRKCKVLDVVFFLLVLCLPSNLPAACPSLDWRYEQLKVVIVGEVGEVKIIMAG